MLPIDSPLSPVASRAVLPFRFKSVGRRSRGNAEAGFSGSNAWRAMLQKQGTVVLVLESFVVQDEFEGSETVRDKAGLHQIKRRLL